MNTQIQISNISSQIKNIDSQLDNIIFQIQNKGKFNNGAKINYLGIKFRNSND